jgi:hypothetical protein
VYKRSPDVAWIGAGLKPVVFGKKKPERLAEVAAVRKKENVPALRFADPRVQNLLAATLLFRRGYLSSDLRTSRSPPAFGSPSGCSDRCCEAAKLAA